MAAIERHSATTGLLRYFEYAHLPAHLQAVSKPVGDLARDMVDVLPDGPELTTGLRKLLEAKDCLVRAALDARSDAQAERLKTDEYARAVSECPTPIYHATHRYCPSCPYQEAEK